jgi:hypothetical protein
MGKDCLDEGDADNADEATSAEVMDLVVGTVITVAKEHAPMCLRGDLATLGVIDA